MCECVEQLRAAAERYCARKVRASQSNNNG